jgi:hypothetical protein
MAGDCGGVEKHPGETASELNRIRAGERPEFEADRPSDDLAEGSVSEISWSKGN